MISLFTSDLKMTYELNSPLRKRMRMEFPPPSSSLYALVDVSMKHNDEEEEETVTDSTNNQEVQFVTRNTYIPGVSSILESMNLANFTHSATPPPSNVQYGDTEKKAMFTPFLLPNPNSYYNPLNPPRPTNQMFPPAPLYPSQYSQEPLPPPPEVTKKVKIPMVGASHSSYQQQQQQQQQQSPQGEQASPSSINFPLSDSPGKVWTKRTNERPIKSNTSTDTIGGGPPLITTDNLTTSNRFILVEQPNDIQRKSYKKENRCLLPNPLIICLKELNEEQKKDPPIVLDGVVSLKLVNNDGTELPPHKQNALESIEGGLTHPLGDDHTTCFSVKVLQTSEGNLFRLIFNVSYRLKGKGRVEEQIISRPFAVYSNKHNRNSRKKQKKDGTIT